MLKELNSILDFLDIGNFRFYLLIITKNYKKLIGLSLLISILTYFISLNLEKKFLSEATLVIAPDENKIVNIEEAYTFDNIQTRVNNQIAILKSEEVISYIMADEKNNLEFKELYSTVENSFIKRILKRKLVVDDEYIKNILRKNFSVNNLPRSDVLQLSFISKSAKISQLALNNIIDSYQRYEIDTKIQITSYANKKITERLKALAAEIDIAEQKLSKYKKEKNLVDTGNVKELKIKEIQNLTARILESEKNKQKLENNLLSIKVANGDVDALLAIDEFKKTTEIINIKKSLAGNESNIQSLLLIYTDKHPKVKQSYELKASLELQLEKILKSTIQEKAFELSNIKNFINSTEEELIIATDELRLIEEKESGMMKYSREVESSNKLYETFLQRVKETNEAQNLQVSKLRIIEMPNLASSAFYPQPFNNFMLSLIISFFSLYLLIFYKEMNSSVIKNPETLSSVNIPQIGALPKVIDTKKGYHLLQLFLEDSESSFSEAVRSSRATIESKFEKNKSFMITSSNPSEGKTTYAFNLALSLEKTNKVLFIEADIRRPSVLNSFYQFDKEIVGLGEIISGTANFDKAIMLVPGTNLKIITSGEKRFDLSDVVNKEQFKKFLDILKIEYDYVIIDSPPVQPVSDTLILAQAADHNFFIIRSDVTKTLSFMSSIKKLQNVGANLSGLILNDIDTSKDSYYSYYYNYSPDYYSKN
jgi:capsular exopolysaccharide synthesis family protein